MFLNNLLKTIKPHFHLNINSIKRKLSTKSVNDILQNGKTGDKIEVKGWIKSLRKQKELVFVDINDGSTSQKLQIVINQENKPPQLSFGAAVTILGRLSTTPRGQIEIQAETVEITGGCVLEDGYPFAPKKDYAPEYLRQYLHLRPRTNKFASLLRIRHRATLEIYNYLDQSGFYNVNTPILTSNDCEGAGEVFKAIPDSAELLNLMTNQSQLNNTENKQSQLLDEVYFNRKVYLTVSGQLHLEAAAYSLGKVFNFGPIFRAENNKTRLHLSEFHMIEAEIAFLDKLDDLINFIEAFIKHITSCVLDQLPEDIDLFKKDNNNVDFSWITKKFPVISYSDAIALLQERFDQKIDSKAGFTKEQEVLLVAYFDNTPVFVINWPTKSKPFYMKQCESDANNVMALDLLAPNIGEIVGGSLRENKYKVLKERIPVGIESTLKWYLDLRQFGGVPTGGFGLGFERFLASILGISNVKDCIPFPRWPHHCDL